MSIRQMQMTFKVRGDTARKSRAERAELQNEPFGGLFEEPVIEEPELDSEEPVIEEPELDSEEPVIEEPELGSEESTSDEE